MSICQCQLWPTYFFAPLVARYVLHSEQYQERTRIETTVKGQTQATDRIYIWDDLTNGYKTSERLAASQLLSPKLYTGLDANRSKLVNDLRDNQPKVIVVNTKTALWTEVEQLLAESSNQFKVNSKTLNFTN